MSDRDIHAIYGYKYGRPYVGGLILKLNMAVINKGKLVLISAT